MKHSPNCHFLSIRRVSSLWGRSMLSLLCRYTTGVILGGESETILANKTVRRFLVFGVLWIVLDFVHTHTTHDCDGPGR